MNLSKIKILTFANENFRNTRDFLVTYLKLIGLTNFINLDENSLTDDFRNEYKEILDRNRGFGYWIWKPYVILNELKKLKSDEILLYLDSADKPEISFFEILLNHLDKNDNFFTNRGFINGEWTKRDCFVYMDCDSEIYHNSVQLEAGIIGLKNTTQNIEIIEEWFNFCKNKHILTDEPNVCGLNNLPKFIDHRHDQSILTNLVLKRNLKSVPLSDEIIKFNILNENVRMSFQNRNQMISTFDKNLKIAELGVFEGEFAKEIFQICEPSELYLVDLFEGYFGSGDKDGKNHHFVQLEDEFEKIKTFFYLNKNVFVEKKSTINFLNSIDDESLDVVYIDADHRYQSVKDDLNLSHKKVKKNGLICGHDYVPNTEAERAVNEFCIENKLKINYTTNDGCPSFCIRKK